MWWANRRHGISDLLGPVAVRKSARMWCVRRRLKQIRYTSSTHVESRTERGERVSERLHRSSGLADDYGGYNGSEWWLATPSHVPDVVARAAEVVEGRKKKKNGAGDRPRGRGFGFSAEVLAVEKNRPRICICDRKTSPLRADAVVQVLAETATEVAGLERTTAGRSIPMGRSGENYHASPWEELTLFTRGWRAFCPSINTCE